MHKRSDAGRACILLAVRNGMAFLPAQLESFAQQDHPDWELIASDDGSTDETPRLLRDFATAMQAKGHPVTLVDGPCRGGTVNFLTLLAQAPDVPWVALSDQDDVWLPDRVSRGIAALQALGDDGPALYCSATIVVDEDLGRPRPSRRVPRPLGFRNALLQNIAAGNTILLNRAAARLVREAAREAADVVDLAAHDWWLYQLLTGAGGTVIYDPTPTLYYRQHGRNQIGANTGTKAGITRFTLVLQGRFQSWNTANIDALRVAADRLTDENRAVVEEFATLRAAPVLARLKRFARLRLYRQSRVGQSVVWLAVLLGRI